MFSFLRHHSYKVAARKWRRVVALSRKIFYFWKHLLWVDLNSSNNVPKMYLLWSKMERTSDSREDLTSNLCVFHNHRFLGKPTMKVFADCGEEFWSFLEQKLPRSFGVFNLIVVKVKRKFIWNIQKNLKARIVDVICR